MGRIKAEVSLARGGPALCADTGMSQDPSQGRVSGEVTFGGHFVCPAADSGGLPQANWSLMNSWEKLCCHH